MRGPFLATLLVLAAPAHAAALTCPEESRYLGETERNLDRPLAAASSFDIALSFGEAEALFGARDESQNSEARDVSQDFADLIQRLERFGTLTALECLPNRAMIAGFDRNAEGRGVILIETKAGVRALEFADVDRRSAIAYARETFSACPPAQTERKRLERIANRLAQLSPPHLREGMGSAILSDWSTR